jgi:hypothetical protein
VLYKQALNPGPVIPEHTSVASALVFCESSTEFLGGKRGEVFTHLPAP